ncbi:MAG: FKBP-type peptidyl-prolyl cis-trans isomerase [Flavobacteriales bacterium]
MKKIFFIAGVTLFTLPAFAQKGKSKNTKNQKTQTVKMMNERDTASYCLGVNIAENLKSQGLDEVNVDLIAQAMSDVLGNNDLAIDQNKAAQIFQNYVVSAQEKKHSGVKEEGENFLAQNAKKTNVKTTASGLQYEVISMGEGPKPTINDKVRTHYHGTLINGTVFDSSVQRGQPISFPLNGVIKGWQEGLQLMPVGSKFRFFIPYDLAYGTRGAGNNIPPYSALIFEVELLGIE